MKNPPSKPPFSASNSRTSKNSNPTSRYSQTGPGKLRHGSSGSGHNDMSKSKNSSQPKNLKSSMSNLHSISKSPSNSSHRNSSPGLTSKDDVDSDFIRVQSNPTLFKSPQPQPARSPLRRKSSSTTNSFGSEPTASILNETFTSSSDTLKEDGENLSLSSEVYPGLQFIDDNAENENNIRILKRKILDLEISNKALSALSHDLETTVKNQNEYIQQLQDYIHSFMNSKDDETAEVNLDIDEQEGETFRVEEDAVNKEECHTEDGVDDKAVKDHDLMLRRMCEKTHVLVYQARKALNLEIVDLDVNIEETSIDSGTKTTRGAGVTKMSAQTEPGIISASISDQSSPPTRLLQSPELTLKAQLPVSDDIIFSNALGKQARSSDPTLGNPNEPSSSINCQPISQSNIIPTAADSYSLLSSEIVELFKSLLYYTHLLEHYVNQGSTAVGVAHSKPSSQSQSVDTNQPDSTIPQPSLTEAPSHQSQLLVPANAVVPIISSEPSSASTTPSSSPTRPRTTPIIIATSPSSSSKQVFGRKGLGVALSIKEEQIKQKRNQTSRILTALKDITYEICRHTGMQPHQIEELKETFSLSDPFALDLELGLELRTRRCSSSLSSTYSLSSVGPTSHSKAKKDTCSDISDNISLLSKLTVVSDPVTNAGTGTVPGGFAIHRGALKSYTSSMKINGAGGETLNSKSTLSEGVTMRRVRSSLNVQSLGNSLQTIEIRNQAPQQNEVILDKLNTKERTYVDSKAAFAEIGSKEFDGGPRVKVYPS